MEKEKSINCRLIRSRMRRLAAPKPILLFLILMTVTFLANQMEKYIRDRKDCFYFDPQNRKFISTCLNFNSLTLSPYLHDSTCSPYTAVSHAVKKQQTNDAKFYPYTSATFSPEYHTKICNTANLRLVVGILTNRLRSDRRQAIRNTFGSLRSCDNRMMVLQNFTCRQIFRQTRLVFIIGSKHYEEFMDEPNQIERGRLQNEQNIYEDIVELGVSQELLDSTTGSLAFFHWASEHCSNAAYLLKSDDESFLQLANLHNILDGADRLDEKHFIIGNGAGETKQLNRKAVAVSNGEALRYFKDACGYVMPIRTARLLYEVGRCVKTFEPDDFYVTGILADSLSVSLLNNPCIRCSRFEVAEQDSKPVLMLAQTAISLRSKQTKAERVWELLMKFYAGLSVKRKNSSSDFVFAINQCRVSERVPS